MNIQDILNKWGIKIDMNTIIGMWNESHRYYHNVDHLGYLINKIDEANNSNPYTVSEYESLILTAVFHDIVYDPMSKTNEEDSAKFLESLLDKPNKAVEKVVKMILETKDHNATFKLSQDFINFDMGITEESYDDLLVWEKGIYNEYKSVGNDMYKEHRIKFLEGVLYGKSNNKTNILRLIEYVRENY